MTANIFYQGVELLLYGMSTVIAFLVLLIGVTRLMSWIIFRFLSESIDSHRTSIAGPKVDNKVIVAIGLALRQFRNSKRNHRSS